MKINRTEERRKKRLTIEQKLSINNNHQENLVSVKCQLHVMMMIIHMGKCFSIDEEIETIQQLMEHFSSHSIKRGINL